MTFLPPFLSARPWLLVVLAFVMLVAVWTTVAILCSKVPTKRMTQDEESVLLQKGARL